MLAIVLIAVIGLNSIFTADAAVSGWTYASTPSSCAGTTSDPCGPAYWSTPAATCSVSSYPNQSPINLDFGEVVENNDVPLPVLTAINGGCKNWTQFTNQYVFEISFQESDCFNLVGEYAGQTYYLNQIHIHSGSEHTIGGGQYSAEAHLVHFNSESSSTATAAFVLGVFLTVSTGNVPLTNNTFFQRFFSPFGYSAATIEATNEMEVETPVNPYASLLPGRHSVYSYVGSLTTPPCTTGIQWFVFDEPVTISPEDLHILRQSVALHPNNLLSQVGNNNRGYTIPLGSRTLSYTTGRTMSPTAAPTQNPQAQASLVLGAVGTSVSIITLFAVLAIVFLKLGTSAKPGETVKATEMNPMPRV